MTGRKSLFGSLLLVAAPVQASNTTVGFIHDIAIGSDGRVRFTTTGTRTTPPACQDTGTFPLTFGMGSGTTVLQSYLSVMLNAYLQHKPVVIYGSATCTTFTNIEDAGAIEIPD